MYYKNLVLGGGGVKGIAYLGVYKYMLRHNITYDNVYGTSVGAIFSVLILLNYEPDVIYSFIRNLYKSLYKLNPLDVFHKKNGFSLLSNKDYKGILTKLIPETLTFKELYDFTGKNLYIVTTDLKLQREKLFSWEHTPNTKVYKAVMASSCVPFLLPLQNNRYIDGGVLYNIYSKLPVQESSLFFVLRTDNEYKNENLLEYISNILRLTFGRTIINNSENFKYVFIRTEVVSSDFGVLFNTDEIKKLIKLGYDTVKSELKQ